MARVIYVVVPQKDVSKAVNSAKAHADAYAVVAISAPSDGKVGILLQSAGAANPEADGSYFTGLTGEL